MKTRRTTSPPRRKTTTFGLVANGSVGGWHVDVDETLSGPQRWYVQIDGPAGYLYFRISHPAVIQIFLDFLRAHLCLDQCQDKPSRRARPMEIELSHLDQMSISLLWDDEGEGRGVFLVRGKGGFVSRTTIAANELRNLAGALQQLRDELDGDGLLSEGILKGNRS